MASLTKVLFDSHDYDDFDFDFFNEEYQILMTKLGEVEGRWKITGTLGLWDGRHDIEPVETESLREAVEKCFGNNDFVKLATDDKSYFVDGVHHDGTNHFVISKID